MRLAPLLARLASALAAALALAACGGTVDFTLEKDLDLDTAVNGGVVRVGVDLATEAGAAWARRDKISAISVHRAQATVTSVTSPTVPPVEVSGTIWLLPEGATAPGAGAVQVATLTGEPVAVGHTVSLTLSPELDAFLESAFNGSGRFSVYAQGTGAGGQVVACRLHVVLDVQVKWKPM